MPAVDFNRIGTNLGALNALNALREVNRKLAMAQTRLATGRRINEAADDPAGFFLATKLWARVEGLRVASSNISTAKNVLAVGEGSLQKISDILVTIRTKAEEAVSDALGSEERQAIKDQISDYLAEVADIVAETKWNGNPLIDGGILMEFQSGADAGETTTLELARNHTAGALGLDLSSAARAATLTAVDSAITAVTESAVVGVNAELADGTYRVVMKAGGKFEAVRVFTMDDGTTRTEVVKIAANSDGTGALVDEGTATAGGTYDTGRGFTVTFAAALTAAGTYDTVAYTQTGGDVMNNTAATQYLSRVVEAVSMVARSLSQVGRTSARLTFKEENLAVAIANTEAAWSRIMNADMAFEQVEATKYAILQQTSLAMLAQANLSPQSILSLFR